jgi:hypothetical protein
MVTPENAPNGCERQPAPMEQVEHRMTGERDLSVTALAHNLRSGNASARGHHSQNSINLRALLEFPHYPHLYRQIFPALKG